MPRDKGKQIQLPGTEDHRIEELHEKALSYVAVRDERMELTKQEVGLADELLKLMKKHSKQKYVCEGTEIRRVPGEEKVKVKVHKTKGAGEDEEAG